MIVPNHENLVYFAFAKSASEWMRRELKLKKHLFAHKDYYNWETCSLDYCHCRPQRYITSKNIGDKHTLFTIIRNPYPRLVSCWAYGKKREQLYGYETFTEFITKIYENKNNLTVLPTCWMYLPFEQYFENVLDKLKVFKLENIDECINYLDETHNIQVKNYICNQSEHEHYSTYYTPDLINKVQEVYAWEIEHFNYKFERQTNNI